MQRHDAQLADLTELVDQVVGETGRQRAQVLFAAVVIEVEDRDARRFEGGRRTARFPHSWVGPQERVADQEEEHHGAQSGQDLSRLNPPHPGNQRLIAQRRGGRVFARVFLRPGQDQSEGQSDAQEEEQDGEDERRQHLLFGERRRKL